MVGQRVSSGGMAMGQRMAIWQGGEDRQLWLSMLIAAMEEASRPEVRAKPIAPAILAGLRAQLAQPVLRYPYPGSAFSLRN
jgi:hypothetical protein